MDKTIDILPISQELEDLTYTNIELMHYDTNSEFKNFMSKNIKLNSIYRLDRNLNIAVDSDSKLNSEVRVYVFTNHVLTINKDEKQIAAFQEKDKFKVIGLRTYKNAACIVVLHLPNQNWEEFYKDNSSIDNQLVHVAIRDFEVQVDSLNDEKFTTTNFDKIYYSLVTK
jgi:hypothetical protein